MISSSYSSSSSDTVVRELIELRYRFSIGKTKTKIFYKKNYKKNTLRYEK